MSKSKNFKVRKPTKFNIAVATYFIEAASGEQVRVSAGYDDVRKTRSDGGQVRPVFYNDNLDPIIR